MAADKIPPVHPGEVLSEDWLIPLGMRQSQLAKSMRVHPARVHEIVRRKRAITAETALRLARAVGTSPDFWLKLQMIYDLQVAKEAFSEIIAQEVIPITIQVKIAFPLQTINR